MKTSLRELGTWFVFFVLYARSLVHSFVARNFLIIILPYAISTNGEFIRLFSIVWGREGLSNFR